MLLILLAPGLITSLANRTKPDFDFLSHWRVPQDPPPIQHDNRSMVPICSNWMYLKISQPNSFCWQTLFFLGGWFRGTSFWNISNTIHIQHLLSSFASFQHGKRKSEPQRVAERANRKTFDLWRKVVDTKTWTKHIPLVYPPPSKSHKSHFLRISLLKME